jgi:hypothetical protein
LKTGYFSWFSSRLENQHGFQVELKTNVIYGGLEVDLRTVQGSQVDFGTKQLLQLADGPTHLGGVSQILRSPSSTASAASSIAMTPALFLLFFQSHLLLTHHCASLIYLSGFS